MPGSKFDVVVIGAGPSGITAARDLAETGLSVVVLEARDRIGGRTCTRPFRGHEDVIVDLGGAYLSLTREHNLRREVERYQIAVLDEGHVADVRFFVDGQLRRGLPMPADQLVAIERTIVAMANDAAQIDPSRPFSEQSLAHLDVSIGDYLSRLELAPEAHDFLTGAIAGGAQCDVEQTSILRILASVQSVGGSPIELFVGLLSQRFRNGTVDLLEAMLRDAGLLVELEQPVVEVAQDTDGVRVTTATGDVVRAAACVVAVPASTLQDITFEPGLDAERQEYVQGESYVHGVKKLLIAENVPDGLFCIGGASARYQWLWEERSLPDGRKLLCAFGMHKVTASNELDVAQTALAEYVPEGRVVGVDGEDWFADPYSRGVLRYGRPGQANALGRTVSQTHGRVVFAGTEFTDEPIFWGWIEGAVARGHVAAGEAAELVEA